MTTFAKGPMTMHGIDSLEGTASFDPPAASCKWPHASVVWGIGGDGPSLMMSDLIVTGEPTIVGFRLPPGRWTISAQIAPWDEADNETPPS